MQRYTKFRALEMPTLPLGQMALHVRKEAKKSPEDGSVGRVYIYSE
jgi:hypothetical protein